MNKIGFETFVLFHIFVFKNYKCIFFSTKDENDEKVDIMAGCSSYTITESTDGRLSHEELQARIMELVRLFLAFETIILLSLNYISNHNLLNIKTIYFL